MNLIIKNSTLEILATTDTEMEVQIVMDSLRDRHDYTAYGPMGRVVEHGADINQRGIIDSLRRMARDYKIEAIKTYRAIYGVSLTEAKAVIEGAHPSY